MNEDSNDRFSRVSSLIGAVVFIVVFLVLHQTHMLQTATITGSNVDHGGGSAHYVPWDSASVREHQMTLTHPTNEPENIYWLFSSSAQAISAFIAFLLTGFALVLTMMDSYQQKDDTLEEIHNELIRDYYRSIKWLSSLTGGAVLLSLAMVYFNGIPSRFNASLIIVTSLVDITAIVGGILFVISIINPDKYRKVARKLFKEEQAAFEPTGRSIEYVEFIRQFIKLETLIRDILRERDLYIRSSAGARMSFSLRQMIEALYNNELIDRRQFDELMELNKYRNLVFHGHLTEVDRGIVDKVNSVFVRLNNLRRQR